jgi:hypothetical protein
VDRVERVEGGEAGHHGAVGDAIESRIEKRAEGRAAAGAARNCTVEYVKERRDAEEPSCGPDVARPVNHAAGHCAERPDYRDCIGMDSPANEPIRDWIDQT